MSVRTSVFTLIAFFLLAQSAVAQLPRGMTSAPFSTVSFICVGEATPIQALSQRSETTSESKTHGIRSDWRIIDSVTLDTWITPLGYAGIRFDHKTRSIEAVRSLPTLRFSAQRAVARCPRWLRAKLEHTLSQLPGFTQDNLAAAINDAVDPYVDEVCFAIAHSTPAYLQSQYCYVRLFTENAELIYAHEKVLPYVDVVDVGTSADDDYYSTVRYWRIDADSNLVQVEVPREIYYWYIVHPKLSDEIPAYVDPTVRESLNAIKPPPQGVFWRNYLFTVTEPVPDTTGVDFLILRDLVSQCRVMWAETGDEPQAVRQITKWIRNVLDFDSGSERPHQPVRIYNLHMGRCGEHEDLTAAAARACLIPARGINAYSRDHVWNEFWDEQWRQWEPVNNSHDDAFVYSERWGWKFGSIMARRSDGKFISVTDDYVKETCTVEIHAKDANGTPVDGATVLIAVRNDQNIIVDTYGSTDHAGVARFIVSADRDYFARFDSPHGGSCPPQSNQVSTLMSNAVSGRAYSFELRSTTVKPRIRQEGVIQNMEDDIEDFVIEHHIDGGAQAIRWQQRFDDINAVAPCVFFSEENGGSLCRGYFDEANFQQVHAQQSFAMKWGVSDQALGEHVLEQIEGVRFTKDLYYLFVNHTNSHNPARIETRFYLKASPLVNVEQAPAITDFLLLDCAPHPVGEFGARLTFSVPASAVGRIRLELWDLLGRVHQIRHIDLQSGMQSIHWRPPSLSRGHYILRAIPGNGPPVQRLLLIE